MNKIDRIKFQNEFKIAKQIRHEQQIQFKIRYDNFCEQLDFAITDGNLEELKKLCDNDIDNILEYESYDFFELACTYDKLEIAQWLQSKYDYEDLTDAFESSIVANNINIVEWMLSLHSEKIDIRNSNDYAFKTACDNDRIQIFFYGSRTKIAQLLTTICKDYYVEIENNEIISYKIKKDDVLNTYIIKK